MNLTILKISLRDFLSTSEGHLISMTTTPTKEEPYYES
jgi:hypothetical protein